MLGRTPPSADGILPSCRPHVSVPFFRTWRRSVRTSWLCVWGVRFLHTRELVWTVWTVGTVLEVPTLLHPVSPGHCVDSQRVVGPWLHTSRLWHRPDLMNLAEAAVTTRRRGQCSDAAGWTGSPEISDRPPRASGLVCRSVRPQGIRARPSLLPPI